MSNQLRRENDFSARITRLEEEVRRLTLREERVLHNPPTADDLSGPRNLEEEYLVESQLMSSLQEQLRTKDEQLRIKDEQLRTMEEQLRIKDKQLQTQQSILATTRKSPKSGGVDSKVELDGRTLLHKAAEEGDLEAVTRLVWCEGADATLRTNWGSTPLHLAAENGHQEVCATLLEAQGVDVNAKDNDEWTPLHYVSRNGKAEVVRLLLEKGADANLRKRAGHTPLHLAAMNGHKGVFATLLDAQGIDVNAKDNDEWTPLHYVSREGKADLVQLLFEKGADATLRIRAGRTPLHLAAMNGHEVVCTTLLGMQGIDVNAKDNDEWTPLHWASHEGKAELVRLLLENGADATLRKRAGHTPLHLAVMNGHEVVCATLLEAQGVDVNANDNYDWTPLHWASQEGKAELVRLLLEKGADATLRNNEGKTPLNLTTNHKIRLMLSSS